MMFKAHKIISKWGKLRQVQTQKDSYFGKLIKPLKSLGNFDLIHLVL